MAKASFKRPSTKLKQIHPFPPYNLLCLLDVGLSLPDALLPLVCSGRMETRVSARPLHHESQDAPKKSHPHPKAPCILPPFRPAVDSILRLASVLFVAYSRSY